MPQLVTGNTPEPPSPGSARPSVEPKKHKVFLVGGDKVTRQEAVDYLSLQKWSREGCCVACFAFFLWMTFLILTAIHTHINVSYDVRIAITRSLEDLAAEASTGIAPKAIYSAAGVSRCLCSCPALCGQTPQFPAGAITFNGTVVPSQLQAMRSKAQWLGSVGQPEPPKKKLADVNTIPDIWYWLQHGMIPQLWHEDPPSEAVNMPALFSETEAARQRGLLDVSVIPGQLLRWNQVIGGVRLRQRRLKEEACTGINIYQDQGEKCHSAEAAKDPFGPGKNSYAEGFVSSEKDKSAYDVYLDTGRPLHIALENIQYMLEAHHWLDDATQSLVVQAALVNAEATPALYGLLEVRFELTRAGNLRKKVQFFTVSVNPYWSFSFEMMADVAWLVLIFILWVAKIVQIIKYLLWGSDEPLCGFWFSFDWVTIVCGLGGAGFWAYLVLESGDVSDSIESLPQVPVYDASLQAVTAYHKAWGDVLDKVEALVTSREVWRLCQFWYTMILIFQFFKAFRGQPKLAQLTRTLINAMEDLVHYVVVFIVVFLNFAFAGHLIYGLRLEAWSSGTKTVNSTFRALMGDIDLPQLYDVAPVTTVVWFWFFLLLMIFLLLNLLLAIAYDHYRIVKAKAGAITGIFYQIYDTARDHWKRHGFKCCCCCCRRREEMPSHAVLLEEIMLRAGYVPEERRLVRRSVLGPKWQRKARQHQSFMGEVPEEIAELLSAPVAQDFKELGVDQDYAGEFEEMCQEYTKREWDPEENEVATMRELVSMAECETAAMRARVAQCQDEMKSNMRDLSKRLASLEKLVHQSLTDLVVIASQAGVPDRTDREVPQQKLGNTNSAIDKSRNMNPAYRRVLTHLQQGTVQKHADAHKDKQANVEGWHRSLQYGNQFRRHPIGSRVAAPVHENKDVGHVVRKTR
mmetsp:Transcript_102608/g.177189  ORF Transcript_102608/g.177189 Transcript_102608/m.177189 type:complete len:913 (+) Transcript_102608:67-2805(+)